MLSSLLKINIFFLFFPVRMNGLQPEILTLSLFPWTHPDLPSVSNISVFVSVSVMMLPHNRVSKTTWMQLYFRLSSRLLYDSWMGYFLWLMNFSKWIRQGDCTRASLVLAEYNLSLSSPSPACWDVFADGCVGTMETWQCASNYHKALTLQNVLQAGQCICAYCLNFCKKSIKK